MSLKLQQLANLLQLEYRGDGELVISGVSSLGSASAGDLCFIQYKKYVDELNRSDCGAVILTAELAEQANGQSILIADDPQYSFVQAIDALGVVAPEPFVGIHPSAEIADSARIAADVSVGALAVIGEHVEIGAGSSIGAGTLIENSVRIGEDCRIHGRVVLARDVILGDRCMVHSGAVIGADGFGLVMNQQQWHKVPQLGSVVIEEDVEIGANTTIDRGALDDTLIERGCKLDNQVQVGHNVRIGAHTAIAGCVGIAGSAVIGCYCKIAGAAVVLGHLSVVDHVTITAMSLVTKDIRQPGVYSSGTPLMENSLWHRNNARYRSLDKIAQSVAKLEKKKP